ncbi:hypothetical protein FQA39_LY04432 [Lamprigera yunnana]|nr:hypothetical protein FQA39_LY04432 [Lamprigera yunnana]
MYKIRDAKNLNEADMLWLLGHDDSDVDNVETNLADSDDNEDYLSEQDEIPDEIFQEENDTISQNSNEGINVLEMQSCDSPVYASKNGMKWSKIPRNLQVSAEELTFAARVSQKSSGNIVASKIIKEVT